MADELIKNLIEKISCELVLYDPENPEGLTRILPVLKRIHTECAAPSMHKTADIVLKAKHLIHQLVENDFKNLTDIIPSLEGMISDLSLSIDVSQSDDSTDTEEFLPDTQETPEHFCILKENLEKFSTIIGGFCPGEIPDLGAMLNQLDELITISEQIEPSTFHQIAIACKDYVSHMTLESIYNTRPIEEGLLLLKSILSHLEKDEAFVFSYADVLELLKIQMEEEHQKSSEINLEETQIKEVESEVLEPEKLEKISDDDMEILMDFISEATDNLDTIEVNLIDLEKDPENLEIINDIFRPFHTIKGVSGFLSLNKINKLSHTTENLLDGARSGNYTITQTVTDAILDSVDTLKQLIEKLRTGTQTGFMPSDDDIDIDNLKDWLEKLQTSLTNGDKEPLGQILVRKKAVDKKNLEKALKIQQESPEKKIGEILVENKQVPQNQVTEALKEQNQPQKIIDTQVKVSTRKLDDLVDYAGELVIAQSMLRQKIGQDPSLSQSVTQLGQIVTNMQTIAMSMRMIPIKATFMKMIRLVRDLSKKSGKQVNLSMTGEETEIDRNVVDALYEPMVHMIRNSVDHGIEAQPDRAASQKPAQGQISLRAYHKGGHIIIEIEDDGKGLDKDRIVEKAKTNGLITGSDQMTDAQIFNLILAPGFSTAEKITDISGRGVGMDVVKAGIEKFRGTLNIESQKGKGTKFTISLPLTLAIIDGMLVGIDQEKYVIPTISIQKAFKPNQDEYFTVEGKGEMIKDRGNLVPVIRLSRIFNTSTLDQETAVTQSLVVIVESKDEKRALVIDELLGKDEYVIKTLGSCLENIPGIAGGAILADGKVGLILDIHGIFSLASAN